MYSYEKRLKAAELLIQYDMRYSTVIRELGYPSSWQSLRNWYKEYQISGNLQPQNKEGNQKFTEEAKREAVDYYLKHGKCVNRACKKLVYPTRTTLTKWINEYAPEEKKPCRKRTAIVHFTQEQKEQAVIDLCARTGSAKEIAEKHSTTRSQLYAWKRMLLPEGNVQPMLKNELEKVKQTAEDLQARNEFLKQEVVELERQHYRLQMEVDILTKAGKILKKNRASI